MRTYAIRLLGPVYSVSRSHLRVCQAGLREGEERMSKAGKAMVVVAGEVAEDDVGAFPPRGAQIEAATAL